MSDSKTMTPVEERTNWLERARREIQDLKRMTDQGPPARGLICDRCGARFTGSPASTTVMWDLEDAQEQRPQVAFLHKTCLTEAWDRASVYCGGGAWFDAQDQTASLDNLLAWRSLLYSEGKAVERYRAFCENGSMQRWPIRC